MRPPARVLVAGAGAVGSVVGAFLSRAGFDVTLLGRPAHVAAVESEGLRVDGVFGEVHARPRAVSRLTAEAGPARLAAWDLVLVAVKSHATAAIAGELARLSPPPALVVSLQNGVGNVEILEAALPASRVLGARVIFGAVPLGSGAVRVTVNAAPVAIGPLVPDPDALAVARDLAAAFAAAGIPAEAVAEIGPVLWAKVLYNCGLNPLGALHGLTYGEVAARPDLRRELEAAIDEGFAVARSLGVRLRWADAAAFRQHFLDDLLPPTAAHRSSMRQDLEAGRPTEIDAICGAIVRGGAATGVPTPVHKRLVDAIHRAERAPEGPSR